MNHKKQSRKYWMKQEKKIHQKKEDNRQNRNKELRKILIILLIPNLDNTFYMLYDNNNRRFNRESLKSVKI